ncbi:MAG: dihydroorotase [Methanomassiliicoccales archaeon]|nr:MAG: dihydroorotase [Methanomassiliicoccales archaeon]
MDIVLEGRAWFKGRLEQCCIGIEDGKVAAVKRSLDGDRKYHYGDMVILPGAIDAHVHFREPGFTDKEDFSTGSISAAFGGVTCAFDMPNTRPATVTLDVLREKRSMASRRSWIDFGLFAGVTPNNDMGSMAKEAIGYKMFMGSSTQSILVTKDEDIKRALEVAKEKGKVLSVHAEEEHMIKKDLATSLADHAVNRPSKAEASAIERLARLNEQTRVNICHVSSVEGMMALKGRAFIKEVAPHHALLDLDFKLGAKGKVNPPLRQGTDRDAVLAAFQQGRFDILASDHAPHSLEDKAQEFNSAPSGVPGVETMVPIMLSLVKKGKLDMSVLVKCAAHNPGDIFGLKKGRIEPGYDADLMVIDPGRTTRIRGEDLHSKCGWTPFEKWDAIFPVSVFLRGEELIRDGNIVGERKGRDVIASQQLSGRSQ